MKRLISIIISIGVILITIYSTFDFLPTKKEAPSAINGKIDLSLWDFDNRNNVQLDGEWEFYPNEFIEPDRDHDRFLSYRDIMKIVHVPNPWNDYVSEDQSSTGIGTYRLTVNLPADDIYGVKTNKINYANRLYLNGYLAGSSGTPSKDFNEYIGNIEMYVGVAPSHEEEMEIVFHVANFEYPTGGIVNSVDFGTTNGVTYLRDIDRAKDTLLIGGYIVLSLIFFFLFSKKKKSRFFLYFSLLCLSVSIHLSLQNEKIMDLIIPNIDLDTLINLQISFIHLATLFFLWFVHNFFKEISNRNIVIIISSIVGLQASLYAIPPLRGLILWGMPMLYKQILIVSIPAIAALYVSIVLIRAFLQKKAEAEYILVIITTFLSYGFLISADFLYNIPVGQVPIVLFTIMILFLALLMERRSELINRQIRQLSKDLLIQDRIKDEFLAKTSVQLGDPLKNIKDISQSLMEGKESALRSDQHESVMLIHRISQRLQYIASDLLDASEIKKDDILIKPKPINLTVLRHVVEEMKRFISNSKNVEIIYDIPDDTPLVLVDEQRLNQIVYNILHNAVIYTNEGTVLVTATVVDEEVNVTISDTGIGISKEEVDNIFTSFYRGENALNDKSRGLGLGLTIVKQLLELSNGRIWVDSTVGIGTKFTFSLPLATEDIPQNKTDRNFLLKEIKPAVELKKTLRYPYKSVGKRKHTILIVGKETEEITELIEIIQSIDYTLIATNSGETALEIMENDTIDLLIVDSALSDISSEEMCRIVRERNHMIELPILILVTVGQLAALDLLYKDNADFFIEKPVNTREIIEGVELLLAMKESSERSIHEELGFYYGQITPHFLYNTLNTIIGLSYKDAEKTREALQHLAVYFRAKLSFYKSNTMISLHEELELIESYVKIEMMRYGDRLDVQFDIDQSVHVEIPPLTLQPLVENAIQHGLVKKGGVGTLYIGVQPVDNSIKITIEDNGVGMTEEKRNEILQKRSKGIGVANSIKRLKLIKNTEFILESKDGIGTKIIILLEGENSNESNYN